jgi:hypothetical protein
MRSSYYGSLYLVTPVREDDSGERHNSVVEVYQSARSHIDVAIELWRLCGREDRARETELLLERAYEDEHPLLDTGKVAQLLSHLEGLDSELKRTLVDAEWRVSPELLPELRKRSRMLDLGEERGELARSAVWEGMSRVVALQSILNEAQRRDLFVALE